MDITILGSVYTVSDAADGDGWHTVVDAAGALIGDVHATDAARVRASGEAPMVLYRVCDLWRDAVHA